MAIIDQKTNPKRLEAQSGFTLVELIIAMTVAAVIIGVTAIAFQSFENNSNQQIEVANVQLNVRGSLAIMERELRMIGQDLNQGNAALFRVSDIRKFDITQPGTSAVPNANGSPILRMSLDMDDDGTLDPDETITYLLYDRDGDGTLFDLARSSTLPGANTVSGRQFLAEGIEALGMSFAFDRNGDNIMDRTAPPAGSRNNGNIIWAIDSNNDGLLDAEVGGAALGYTVLPDAIQAIQLTILARAKNPDPNYRNTQNYSVGDQVIAVNDNFRRWMLTHILYRRNRG